MNQCRSGQVELLLMQRQQRKSRLSSMWFHLINKLPLNLPIHPQDRGARHPLTYSVLLDQIWSWQALLYKCCLWARCFHKAPLHYFYFLSVTVFKICPDSQLCNSVNDGCRCCWSAQVTTRQKNESNRCCWQWDLYTDTETSLIWGHLEVEQMDMPVCRCLATFIFTLFLQDHGGVGVTACL